MWQRAEVKELCNVLHEDETISEATNGYYEGGFSLLVATNQRLLLVDRKPMFLTLDSIAYSMIQEVSFNYRLLNSTIHIYTTNKCLDFNSWHHSQIRSILNHTQAAMRQDRPPQYNRQYVEQRPLPMPEPQYMSYEQLSVPEIVINSVPYMSTPSHVNDNTQSAYAPVQNVATLPVEPANLAPSTTLSAIKTSVNRQYARRYY